MKLLVTQLHRHTYIPCFLYSQAKLYAQVNCNETLAGPTYQFSYEMDMGGGGICDNRNSIIKACQSPGSPYLDNQVFTMMFASCPDIPASVDTGQCTESKISLDENQKVIGFELVMLQLERYPLMSDVLNISYLEPLNLVCRSLWKRDKKTVIHDIGFKTSCSHVWLIFTNCSYSF